MQKIVLFIEPNADKWITPFKIGELFMKRFFFEEKNSFKIVKIFELGKSSFKLPLGPDPVRKKEYSRFEIERNKKGMNLSTLSFKFICPIRKS